MVVGLFISSTLLGFRTNISPKEHVNQRIAGDIDLLIGSIEKLEGNDIRDNLFDVYREVRENYKRIEAYVVFRYPVIDKAINGGPVPSIETEIVILHKDDPHGLQVLEEIINGDDLDSNHFKREITLLKKQVQLLQRSFDNRPLLYWEILEANHLAITRLMTLGLSGFDSPEFLLSISDAQIVLQQLKIDLQPFNQYLETSNLMKRLLVKCNEAIDILESCENFESLSRFEYYRDQLVPIQKLIKGIHNESGFEHYDEYSTVPRSISRASHMFDVDYLNPFFTIRGGSKNVNDAQIELGKVLFYDPVLSGNFKRSCASCHNPDRAFSDGETTSIAFDMKGNIKRNSPTLINSAYQSNFFYDLKSPDMNDQIMHVFNDTAELNINRDEIVTRLKSSHQYAKMFEQAYSTFEEPISIGTVKSSLEMYVRSLQGLNSKFDRNIRKISTDFTEQEIKGANLFLGKASCATCHFPPMFNGYVPPHYQETEGEILGVLSHPNSKKVDSDFGRYELYKLNYPDADYIKGMFKTSTVRNIEFTAPYMHNGTYETLEDVVDFYNHGGAVGIGIDWHQQTLAPDSLNLDTSEKASLIAFMKTLSDTTSTRQKSFPLPQLSKDYPNRVWGGEY